MKFTLKLLLLILLPSVGLAQGAHRLNQVLVKGNNTAANVGPYAKIRVCAVNTDCNVLVPVFADSTLLVPMDQPIIADGSGNYNYYITSGCVDENISSPGQGSFFLRNVCPFNGQGGTGGGLNPGLQTQMVFYPTDGTVGGPTNVQTDKATGNFLTAPNTNGTFNTDRFTSGSGNNGLSNLATTTCTSGNCTAAFPANSGSGELVKSVALPNNFVVPDGRAFNRGNTYHNCLIRTVNFGMQDFCEMHHFYWDSIAGGDVNLFSTGIDVKTTFQNGYSFGNAVPNMPTWTVAHGHSDTAEYDSRGIAQLYSYRIDGHKIGDEAGIYGYHFCDGGATAASDEGCGFMTLNGGESSQWFHGIAATGATTGTRLLPATVTAGSNSQAVTTDGAYMLDITKGSITGHATGLDARVPGTAAYAMPVDVALTPSTQWGIVNTTLTVPNPPLSAGISQTINVTLAGGTATQFVVGHACLAGSNFPEQVEITAAPDKSGTAQTITLTHRNPDIATNSSLWQGGPCGQYLSLDRNIARDGFRTSYEVMGATDANHLVYVFGSHGGVLGNILNYFQPPANIFSLSRNASDIVTATFNGGGVPLFTYQQSVVFAGATDPSFNATCANTFPILVPSTGFLSGFTCTQIAPAAGPTGGTKTASMPATFNAFHLYPGAEVIGPQIGNSVPLEANTVAWAPGDVIENPHNPSYAMSSIKTSVTQNTLSSGANSSGINNQYQGSGISNNFSPNVDFNFNPCSLYIGCGGSIFAPAWNLMNGPYSTLYATEYSPQASGPLFKIGSSQIGDHHGYTVFGVENGGIGYAPIPAQWTFSKVVAAPNVVSPLISTGDGSLSASGLALPFPVALTSDNSIAVGRTYGAFGNETPMDTSADMGAHAFYAGLVYGGSIPPTGGQVFNVGIAGSTTYSYVAASVTQTGVSLPTAAVATTTGNATLSGTNSNYVKFNHGLGSQTTNVYRVSGGGLSVGLICSNVANNLIGSSNSGCFDTGQTATTAIPTADTSGRVQSASGVFGTSLTVAGQNVCQANGTNCPATAAAAAGTLTGTALNSTVVTSSLTSVGTLGSLTVSGLVTAGSLATTQTPAASTTASDHSIPIVLNGTTYFIRLSTTP